MKNIGKKQKRELASCFTTIMFIIVGITGIMMFFHVLDGYVRSMHEIIGIVFCVAVMFYVIFNFNSMKKYFKKKMFIYSAIVTVIFSIALTAISGSDNHRDRNKGKHNREHYSIINQYPNSKEPLILKNTSENLK